jgi:hypothetical protein
VPQDQRQAQIEINSRMATWAKVVGIFTRVLAIVNIATEGFVWWQALLLPEWLGIAGSNCAW